MTNFIDYLVEFQKDTESPNEYWRWAAIAGVAALLRNNVWFSTKIGRVYPNVYVILMAGSGNTRKGAPCKFVGKLIQKVGGTKFINGRASMQAVIRDLGSTITTGNGITLSGAAALLFSEELSSFVVQDPAAIPLLIDLYDYHETWQTSLISSSTKLENVCVSLLAASNEDLMKLVFSEAAMKGGLLGRTFIVSANKAKTRRSLLDLNIPELSIEPIVEHLKRILVLRGEIGFDGGAKEAYNDWYYGLDDTILGDPMGFGSRVGTHVLKLSMIIAASRSDFVRVVNADDVIAGVQLVMPFVARYKSLLAGAGASQNSQQMSLVIQTIIRSPGLMIKHEDLVRRLYSDFTDAEQLNAVIGLLAQAGLIMEVGVSGLPGYKLTAEGKRTLGAE